MQGHIDDVFESYQVTQLKETSGGYVDGRWQEGATESNTYRANVQPASDRQIQTLQAAGRRIIDVRNVWINNATLALSIAPTDKWEFEGKTFETVSFDNRPSRVYAKITVSQVVE